MIKDLVVPSSYLLASKRTWIQAVRENIEALEKEYSWALLHRMYERAAAQTGACIVLLSNRHFAAAEALCRTAIEACVDLCYCSGGDSVGSILNYFKAHIVRERDENRRWATSLNSPTIPTAARDEHLRRIREKDEALAIYERIITETFAQIGHSYAEAEDTWPSIYSRFKALNKEVGYRTIYAALCSQAHNDAEDLINNFVHGVSHVPGSGEAQERENQNFSRTMVLVTVGFLIESAAIYLAKYPIGSNDTLLPLLKRAMTIGDEVAQAMNPRA